VNSRAFLVLTFFVSATALVAHAQSVSPDGSSITPSSGGSLVTTDGTWTFGTVATADGNEILLNGQGVGNGYAVKAAVYGGKIRVVRLQQGAGSDRPSAEIICLDLLPYLP
jgi:hypothetical protein